MVEAENHELHWYALKVFYNKVFAVEEELTADGTECYVPVEETVVERGGQGLDDDSPLPVHRGDDAGRHLRQRASGDESHLGNGMGREVRHPRRHDERRGLDQLPSSEGLARL